MVTAEEIVHPRPADPADAEWLVPPYSGVFVVAGYDPAWPEAYQRLAERIVAALGEEVLALDHVGSTSVPGLAAKAVIDVNLTVADSSEESRYIPQLEAAGFTLVLRERAWYQHRLLTYRAPRAHLHVWSPESPEVVRTALLRDWLREHPEDRAAYEAAKHAAADALGAAGGGLGSVYNDLKAPVIHEILQRVFRAHGLL